MKRTAALLRKDPLTPGPSPPWGRGEKSSIWNAFAAGSALAKAVFEFGCATKGSIPQAPA